MPSSRKRLGDAELEIMMILWHARGQLTATQIQDALHERRAWPLSTVMTALARLADKGFVACDRTTRTNLYCALISEEAYKQSESRSFLEKLYDNSLQNFVATLYDARAIDERDLQALKDLIAELERKHHDT